MKILSGIIGFATCLLASGVSGQDAKASEMVTVSVTIPVNVPLQVPAGKSFKEGAEEFVTLNKLPQGNVAAIASSTIHPNTVHGVILPLSDDMSVVTAVHQKDLNRDTTQVRMLH